MDGRRDCRRSVLRRMLRRLPCALLALGLTATLGSVGVLATRRAQELTGRGAVEQPRLNAAYAQGSEGPAPEAETAHPARFATNLTYTSLDAPDDGSAVARVTWDDAWFSADEGDYNHELAQTSSVLAALAYSESGYYQARENHPPYMENALASLGFGEVSTESYRYRSKVVDEVLDLATGDADGAAYTIARKRLGSGHDGPARDLILVSARGSYGSEWLSNLDMSRDEAGDHGGYVRAAREIGAEVVSWAEESRALGAEVSVLLVGHSRGGAIANLVAAELDDLRAQAGDAASFGPVYAYTFAAPATTLASDARSERTATSSISPTLRTSCPTCRYRPGDTSVTASISSFRVLAVRILIASRTRCAPCIASRLGWNVPPMPPTCSLPARSATTLPRR